jgi:hypothetical protein
VSLCVVSGMTAFILHDGGTLVPKIAPFLRPSGLLFLLAERYRRKPEVLLEGLRQDRRFLSPCSIGAP